MLEDVSFFILEFIQLQSIFSPTYFFTDCIDNFPCVIANKME